MIANRQSGDGFKASVGSRFVQLRIDIEIVVMGSSGASLLSMCFDRTMISCRIWERLRTDGLAGRAVARFDHRQTGDAIGNADVLRELGDNATRLVKVTGLKPMAAVVTMATTIQEGESR